jgi:hypothetical protein
METYNLLFLSLVSKTVTTQTPTGFLQIIKSLLGPLNIFESQLSLDGGHITEGVNVAIHVDDFGVVERSNHLKYPIDGTDV